MGALASNKVIWQVSNIANNNTDERQAKTLTLQRRNIVTVPEDNPLQHRAIAPPPRAKVVGLKCRTKSVVYKW